MQQIINSLRMTIVVIFLTTALGCSAGNSDPVIPLNTPTENPADRAAEHNRMLWGMWQVVIEQGSFEVTLEPMREISAHFNITDWLLPPACDDCLKIDVNSFDPVTRILDADVTLRNPTHLSGYDIRGILYTNDYGHLLKNADAWTDLWDIPGGEDINPFRAFAKAEPNRIFESDAEHTENYLIYIPEPPNWNQITFAVDASWPNNCRDPYDITNFFQESVYDVEGSSGIIQVDIFDWQGDVSEVILELPEITGVDETPLIHMPGSTWSTGLMNATGAFAGTYLAKITARSANSGTLALYDFVEIIISEQNIEFNPVEITPPGLNFNPFNMLIEGDYLYVVSNTITYEYYDKTGGLHIFDISDPVNPVPVNSVLTVWEDEEYLPMDLVIADGYAYLACYEDAWHGLLMIIDIDPVESASILTAVIVPAMPQDVDVANGYAYMATYGGFYVVDIHQPGSPFVILNINPGGDEVIVSGDFAYVSTRSASLPGRFSILNVSDPENPFLVKSIEVGDLNWSFSISNGYAYVVNQVPLWGGLQIIDIDPPEDMCVINSLDIHAALDIDINNGYAYIATYAYGSGLSIVDISQPGSEYVLTELEFWDTYHYGCLSVAVSEGYAYVGTRAWGIYVVDISNPVSPELLNTVYTLSYARKISISDGYAYLLDSFLNNSRKPFGIDIDPLDSMKTLVPIYPDCWAHDVLASGGYAFLADGLAIVDVDPIENAYTVTTVDVGPYSSYDWARNAMAIDDGYLFLAGYDEVPIVDIDPVEEAHLAHVITGVDKPYAVAVVGDYAYACGDAFYIIDIASIDSPEILKTLPVKGEDMAVSSGHAFIVDNYAGLTIIDVNPPDSAHIILSISNPDYEFYSIKISGGYAYVNDFGLPGKGGLRIFDISPPVTAHLVETIELPADPVDFEIYNNRAYICCGYKGVRVYELW